MSKILAVFGATGQQGGSVIDYVLSDPELSQTYTLRAICRDTSSSKAQLLKSKGVEVVQADIILSRASVEAALTGVHTVFAMTAVHFGPDGYEVEYNSAKTMADVAVEKGVEYFIFSTLPPAKEISGGKYASMVPFDVKADAERYIRGLPIKSAFYCPGSFMQNFVDPVFMAPHKGPDDTWIMARHTSGKTPFPLIDVVGDGGKFVGAILADPEKYEGKRLCAATKVYTSEEIVAAIAKATGKKVVFKQVPVEEFRESIGNLPDMFVELFDYYEEFGYFGPETESLVAWAAENARGKLTTFEEFLEKNPNVLGLGE